MYLLEILKYLFDSRSVLNNAVVLVLSVET